jgi:diguanylate cyclase (GGDEF)-like protein/PAS domain S-box-containing protein
VSPAPASTKSLRAVLKRAIPALIGFALILSLSGTALWVGRSNLEAAERSRLVGRASTVQSIGNVSGGNRYNPDGDARIVASATFDPDAPAVSPALVKQFVSSGAPATVAVLVAPDGRTLAASSPGAQVDVAPLGAGWADAVAGRPGYSNVFHHGGQVAYASLVPIGGPEPWAVLVAVRPALGSPNQEFFQQVGSLNSHPGGLAIVDRQGVALQAWSPHRMGESVVSAADIAALPAGSTRTWTAARDGVETTFIGTDLGHGYALVFEQRSDDLFEDLRASQHLRDVVLLAVLGVALAALLTFQLRREVSARRAESRLQALLANSHDLVLVADGRGELVFVSQAIDRLLGKQPDAWWFRPVVDLCHPDDRARVADLLEHPGSGPRLNVRLADTRAGRGRDRYRFFDIDASDVRDHPEVGGVLLTCHEVGQRKQLQDELSHQATHDQLTGLANRSRLSAQLDALIRDGHPVHPFALLYIDLDKFKPVNDTLGHEAGDEVLVAITSRLRAAVGEGEVFRLGGDEFAALIERVDAAAAVAATEAILDAVGVPVETAAGVAEVGASIGIALAEPSLALTSGEQLLRRADRAMYAVKHDGRGHWLIAGPDEAFEVEGPVARPLASRADVEAPTPAPEARATVAPETPLGRPRRRFRMGNLAPLAVAGALVVGIAGVGFHQTQDRQLAAEAELRNYVTGFLARTSVSYTKTTSVAAIAVNAAAAPWTLNGSPIDAAVAKAFATAPQTGEGGRAVLAEPNGSVLAAYPVGTTLAFDPASPDWRRAAAGEDTIAYNVGDPADPYGYYLIPIKRDGQVTAVLTVGLSQLRGGAQQALEDQTWGGLTNGGWSTVTGDGKIVVSWNPALTGTQQIDPARLVGQTPGAVIDLTTDDEVIAAAPMPLGGPATYLTWAMPANELYRDVRAGQLQRDLSLLAVVAGIIFGLALVNGRRERALRRSEARIAALLAQSHDIIVVLDDRERATFVSSAADRLLGYPDLGQAGTGLIGLLGSEDRARIVSLIQATRRHGSASLKDLHIPDREGVEHVFDVEATDLAHHRDVRGLLLTCHEVTERRALQDKLAVQARRDPLTGLPNRAELYRMLDDLGESGPFAVLFADLDGFKSVNDTFGHDAGDQVLRVIAERFVANVRHRPGGGGDEVCRLGGDELAIVVRGATEEIARSTADRLVDAASQPIHLDDDVVVGIGASIGVALVSGGRGADTSLQLADRAMYQAKQAGRGQYAVAVP